MLRIAEELDGFLKEQKIGSVREIVVYAPDGRVKQAMKEIIATDNAPKAIGPYSQAVKWGGLVYCSGQIPLDPATGAMVEGGIAEQTAAGAGKPEGRAGWQPGQGSTGWLKTTVFLQDLTEFQAMNEVYAKYFANGAPARATVQAARLPRDVRVEIECIAARYWWAEYWGCGGLSLTSMVFSASLTS